MKLNKVIKKLKVLEKDGKNAPGKYDASVRLSYSQSNSGFHAKASSTKGAARQRSMGTRDSKSGA
jgi:hypothetical protein